MYSFLNSYHGRGVRTSFLPLYIIASKREKIKTFRSISTEILSEFSFFGLTSPVFVAIMKVPNLFLYRKELKAMKNIVKILALVLVLSMVTVVFASCGNTLSGTYKNDGLLGLGDSSLKFSGKKVTYTLEGESVEGKYEIKKNDEGKQVIVFDFEDDSIASLLDEQELPFEKIEGGIKIAGTKYTKD